LSNICTLEHLRRYAIARSLFKPTSLMRAIAQLGFVQMDPIRAPARAQDLCLRHRVVDYRAGDLEANYPRLALEEDFFINYGILPRASQALMHPRIARKPWPKARAMQAEAVLEFVRSQGVVHPREVDAVFQHGTSKNWFGGNSRASTQLLDEMHYRGLLRVARRESGTRLYAPAAPYQAVTSPEQTLDALIDIIVAKYAPIPASTLNRLCSWLLSRGVGQWQSLRAAMQKRNTTRLPHITLAGRTWYWPEDEDPCKRKYASDACLDDRLRLLAPFDPIVWDRDRFESFWGWAYRFEAYTPAEKRVRGYYALPVLWRGQIQAWVNVKTQDHRLEFELGSLASYTTKDPAFARSLEAERSSMSAFLGL
jgi:uncharacterized protein